MIHTHSHLPSIHKDELCERVNVLSDKNDKRWRQSQSENSIREYCWEAGCSIVETAKQELITNSRLLLWVQTTHPPTSQPQWMLLQLMNFLYSFCPHSNFYFKSISNHVLVTVTTTKNKTERKIGQKCWFYKCIYMQENT